MENMIAIITALGSLFVPVAAIITNILTYLSTKKSLSKNDAKNSILQMIMEDHQAVQEGKFPANYQNILHEFDIYKASGGNSYIEKKLHDYTEWYDKIEAEWKHGDQ